MPELLHQRHHVARHLGLGIGRVVRRRAGLEGAAIAAQVGAIDGEAVGQRRRDAMPHRMGLRVAVQQQQRRPLAAMAQAQPALRQVQFGESEALEKHRPSARRFVATCASNMARLRRGSIGRHRMDGSGEARARATGLDPADWTGLRALGHGMLDAMFDHVEGVAEGPVWQRMPEAMRAELRSPLPRAPEGGRRRRGRMSAAWCCRMRQATCIRASWAGCMAAARRSACWPRCWPAGSTPIAAGATTRRSRSSARSSPGQPRCSACRRRPPGCWSPAPRSRT